MRERTVEEHLVAVVSLLGGTAEKFVSPGKRSVPDRLITMPGRPMFFVEVKRPGKDATPAQKRDHTRREKLGQVVYVVDTKEQIDKIFSGVWL